MEDLSGKTYMKQAELAERWRCSQGTIIGYRKQGLLPFFQLPSSSMVLYPLEEILEIERKYTVNHLKAKGGDKKPKAEMKKVEPCVSSPKKEWRI